MDDERETLTEEEHQAREAREDEAARQHEERLREILEEDSPC